MHRRSLLNLVLLILVAGLTAVAVWEPGNQPDQPTGGPLTQIDPATINRLSIERPNNEPLELVRKDDRWYLTQPLQLPASRNRIESVLALLSAHAGTQFDAGDRNLAEFGLNSESAIRIRLNEQEILIGGSAPISHQRYVSYHGKIALIQDTLHYQLTLPEHEWITPELLPADSRILRLQTPAFTLARSDSGGWLRTGIDESVSADAIQTLVESWRYARAISISPAPDEASGDAVVVELEGMDDPIRFLIQNRDNQTSLVRTDWQIRYHLTESGAASLLQSPVAEAAKAQQ